MVIVFTVSSVGTSYAQLVPTSIYSNGVSLSASFTPPLLKGIKFHPNNPFSLDFILDKGDRTDSTHMKEESTRLIKYFLASVTVPEKDLWVNLSPYEKDSIVPDAFGITEMGRDLLTQDYMLKQITASVIYPEGDVGKEFWERVNSEAQRRYGTSNVSVDTLNRVWIVPEKAVVYENYDSAYVIESKLKVMLEEDYLAINKNLVTKKQDAPVNNKFGSEIIREIVIPILEKEVNEGMNFSQLRQIYHSLILATWYKDKVRNSLFGKAYVDQKKTGGVEIDDKEQKEKIWAKYVQTFKKGVYNYIKEDFDPLTQEIVPRKYFSGGNAFFEIGKVEKIVSGSTYQDQLPKGVIDRAMIVQVDLSMPSNNRPVISSEQVLGIATQKRKILEWNRKNHRVNEEAFNILSRYLDKVIGLGVEGIESGVSISRVDKELGKHINTVFDGAILNMITEGEKEMPVRLKDLLTGSISDYLSAPAITIVKFTKNGKEAQPPKIVHKPWGMEVWAAENEVFGVKFIYVVPGEHESVQQHDRKMESHLYFGDANVVHINHADFEFLKKSYGLKEGATPDEVEGFVQGLPYARIEGNGLSIRSMDPRVVHVSKPTDGVILDLELNAGEEAASPTVTTRLLDKYDEQQRASAGDLAINWWGARLPIISDYKANRLVFDAKGKIAKKISLLETDGVTQLERTLGYEMDIFHFSENESKNFVNNTRTTQVFIVLDGEFQVFKDGKEYSLNPGEIFELPLRDNIVLKSNRESRLICVQAPAVDSLSGLVKKAEEKREAALFIAPQSSLVIDAAIETAKKLNEPAIFIPSRNQVDIDRLGAGYVAGWDQERFVAYVNSRLVPLKAQGVVVYFYRDHGGPWQRDEEYAAALPVKEAMDNAKSSYLADLKAGFTALHIDASRSPFPAEWDPQEEGKVREDILLQRTVELIEYVEKQRMELGISPITYEVRGERKNWDIASVKMIDQFLTNLTDALAQKGLSNIDIGFVTANPTPLKERGSSEAVIDRLLVAKLSAVVKKHGLELKYHNGDFMRQDDLESLPALGVHAVNIAPEFPMQETKILLKLADQEEELLRTTDRKYAGVASNFREVLTNAVLNNGRWKKWLKVTQGLSISALREDSKALSRIIEFNGHYVFNEPAVEKARQLLEKNIREFKGDSYWEVATLGQLERKITKIRSSLSKFKKKDELSKLRPNIPEVSMEEGSQWLRDRLLAAYRKKGRAILGIQYHPASKKNGIAQEFSALWNDSVNIPQGKFITVGMNSYLIPPDNPSVGGYQDRYERQRMFADIKTLQQGGDIYVPQWTQEMPFQSSGAPKRKRVRLRKKDISEEILLRESETILRCDYKGQEVFLQKSQWEDSGQDFIDVLEKISASGNIILVEGDVNFSDPETNKGYDAKAFIDLDWDSRFLLAISHDRNKFTKAPLNKDFQKSPLRALADVCIVPRPNIETIIAAVNAQDPLIAKKAREMVNQYKGTSVLIKITKEMVSLIYKEKSGVIAREHYSSSGQLLSKEYYQSNGRGLGQRLIAKEDYDPQGMLKRIQYVGGSEFNNDLLYPIRNIRFEKDEEGKHKHTIVLDNGDEWVVSRDKVLWIERKWLSTDDRFRILSPEQFLAKAAIKDAPLVLGADGTVGASVVEEVAKKKAVVALIGKMDGHTSRQVSDSILNPKAHLVHIKDIMTVEGLRHLEELVSKSSVVHNFFGHHQVSFPKMEDLLNSFFIDLVCTAVLVELCRKYNIPIINPSSEHVYQYVQPIDAMGARQMVDDSTVLKMPGNSKRVRRFIRELTKETLAYASRIVNEKGSNIPEVESFMKDFLKKSGFSDIGEINSNLKDWYLIKTISRELMVNTMPEGTGINLRFSKVFGKRNRLTHYTSGQAIADIIRGIKDHSNSDECCFLYTGDLGWAVDQLAEMVHRRELKKNLTMNLNSMHGDSVTAHKFHQKVLQAMEKKQVLRVVPYPGRSPIIRPVYSTKQAESLIGLHPTPLDDAVKTLTDYWESDLGRYHEFLGAASVRLNEKGVGDVTTLTSSGREDMISGKGVADAVMDAKDQGKFEQTAGYKIVRYLSGGSKAKVMLIERDGKLLVRKEENRHSSDEKVRLMDEILFLKNLPESARNDFIKVTDSYIPKGVGIVWYEMPYYSPDKWMSLEMLIIKGMITPEQTMAIIKGIIASLASNGLYEEIKVANKKEYIDKLILKLKERMEEAAAKSKEFAAINDYPTVIEGQEYPPVREMLKEVIEQLGQQLAPEKLYRIHGDLYPANILVNFESLSETGLKPGTVLLDPRGDPQGQDLYYELAKMGLSIINLFGYTFSEPDAYTINYKYMSTEGKVSLDYTLKETKALKNYREISRLFVEYLEGGSDPIVKLTGGEFKSARYLTLLAHTIASAIPFHMHDKEFPKLSLFLYIMAVKTMDLVRKGKVLKKSNDPDHKDIGGIDLTSDKMKIQIKGAGSGVHFNFDSAMINQLQNASGLFPLIIDMRPMTTTVQMFLDIKDNAI